MELRAETRGKLIDETDFISTTTGSFPVRILQV